MKSIIYNGIEYKVGDKYRVVKLDGRGGHEVGTEHTIGDIIQPGGVFGKTIKIYSMAMDYWNPIENIELLGRFNVARPEEFKVYSCYSEFENDGRFFGYMDEEFEIVLQIGQSLFPRTENDEIKSCMKEWIIACKPKLLSRFKDFVMNQYYGDTKEYDKYFVS